MVHQMDSETQIKNEEANTQITSNSGQSNKTKFYVLVLIQQIVILISTCVPALNWFIDSDFDHPRKDVTFHEWCQINKGCQYEEFENSQKELHELNNIAPGYIIEKQNFAEWKFENYGIRVTPQYSFYVSQAILLIIILGITNFRDRKLVRDYQKPLYIIQLLFLSILIQYLYGYADFYFENKQVIQWFKFTLTFLIINLIFLVINEKKYQINHSTIKEYLINFYSFAIFFTGVGYQLGLFNSNYAIQLFVFIILQFQLLKLQQHLFNENNKYNKFNKSLAQLMKSKIIDVLFLEKLTSKMPDYFMIHKRLFIVSLIGVIISIVFRDYILTIPFLLIVMLAFGILFLDTSILSTKFQLTLNDSHLAASLFVLDCWFPIRNLIIEALIVES